MCEQCIKSGKATLHQVSKNIEADRKLVTEFVEHYSAAFAHHDTSILIPGLLQILAQRLEKEAEVKEDSTWGGAKLTLLLPEMMGVKLSFDRLAEVDGKLVPVRELQRRAESMNEMAELLRSMIGGDGAHRSPIDDIDDMPSELKALLMKDLEALFGNAEPGAETSAPEHTEAHVVKMNKETGKYEHVNINEIPEEDRQQILEALHKKVAGMDADLAAGEVPPDVVKH